MTHMSPWAYQNTTIAIFQPSDFSNSTTRGFSERLTINEIPTSQLLKELAQSEMQISRGDYHSFDDGNQAARFIDKYLDEEKASKI